MIEAPKLNTARLFPNPFALLFRPIVIMAILTCANAPVWAAELEKAPPETTASSKVREARAQQRLEWNRKVLAGVYQKVGKMDAKWDALAHKTLEETAQLWNLHDSNRGALEKKVFDLSQQTIQAGCDDPLVLYLNTRNAPTARVDPNKLADQYGDCADRLRQSAYSPICKFYAHLQAADKMKAGYGRRNTTSQNADFYRRAALTNLLIMLEDMTIPIDVLEDACLGFLQVVEFNQAQYGDYYRAIEKPLFQNRSKEGGAFLVKGAFYINHAWHARTTKLANEVTEQGWKLFLERLKIASQSLERAWELDPHNARICQCMINVELGRGEDRQNMERWFQRGMQLNPNNYELCRLKLNYLEPKWHGGLKEMREFGQECVESKRWGGRVPLILVDVYDNLCCYLDRANQTQLWQMKEVWVDIRSAYEKFFKINSEDSDIRSKFAMYAYRCEQWNVFLEQVKLLGNAVNREYFGGQTTFERMVETAKQRAKEQSK